MVDYGWTQNYGRNGRNGRNEMVPAIHDGTPSTKDNEIGQSNFIAGK